MKHTMKNTTKLILAGVAAAAVAAPGIAHAVLKRPKKEKKNPKKKTIACIGDSITFGSGVVWTRKTDAWPYQLGRLLGEEYQVVNYGISGATMQKISDQPYRLDFWWKVEEMKTEAVILMLGTNDSKPQNWSAEEFEKAYREAIERLCVFTKKLIVMTPPRAFTVKGEAEVRFDIRNEVIHDEIYPIVLRLAEAYHVPVIDLYRFTEEHSEYFVDGVHPNKLGNRMIAEYVFERLGIK